MIVIILYITVAFPNHSSRRLLASQKPTTLRKNVAKLNETSPRYFKLILDPIGYIQFDAIYRGGNLSINYRKTFQIQLLFLSLFDPSLLVHNVIFVMHYSDIVSWVRGKRILLYYTSLSITYVRNVCDQRVMHDSRYCKSSVKFWRSRSPVVERQNGLRKIVVVWKYSVERNEN